jgi:hypothetical protein
MLVTSAIDFTDSIGIGVRVAVANSIASVVDALIPGDPPMGGRTITLLYRSDHPRVLWESLDYTGDTYRIAITSTDAKWQQLAFQLSHELAHVKFGPARSNLLLEVFAIMSSLRSLHILQTKWANRPPFAGKGWTKLAATFATLISNETNLRLNDLSPGIRNGFATAPADEQLDRLKDARAAVNVLPLQHSESRAWQHAAALILLKTDQVQWEDLLGLGLNTIPRPADEMAFCETYPLVADSIPRWVPMQLQ